MTREEIRASLIRAKDSYLFENESSELCGMCHFIAQSLGVVHFSDINDIIPKFNFWFACDNFGASGESDGFWWNEFDVDSRIKYFDYLIKLYSDEKSST